MDLIKIENDKQIAALKLKAAGQPDGGGDEGGVRAGVDAADEAALKERLAESTNAQRVALEEKIANMAALHEVATEVRIVSHMYHTHTANKKYLDEPRDQIVGGTRRQKKAYRRLEYVRVRVCVGVIFSKR